MRSALTWRPLAPPVSPCQDSTKEMRYVHSLAWLLAIEDIPRGGDTAVVCVCVCVCVCVLISMTCNIEINFAPATRLDPRELLNDEQSFSSQFLFECSKVFL